MAHVFNPSKARNLLSEERLERQPLGPILGRLRPEEGQTWLDLGAGSGFVTVPLLERGCRVVAMDAQREMLDLLLERVSPEALPRLEAVEAELPPIPLPDGSVDGVVMVNVFHEVGDRPLLAREMLRVLRPGGRAHLLDHRPDSDKGGSPRQDRLRPSDVEAAFGREARETHMEESYYHLIF